jgi:hypothetical protein
MLLQIRLRRFMSWLLAAFLTLAVLMTFVSLRMPTVNRMLGTASIYGVLAALLVTRFALLHRPVAAITTISAGFFCLAMADVVLLPRALPVMIFLPVSHAGAAISHRACTAGPQHGATLTIAVIASLSRLSNSSRPH